MAISSRAANPEGQAAMENEGEQRKVYDQRIPTWPVRLGSIVFAYLWFTQLGWKLPWNNFGSPGEQPNGVQANLNITAQQPGPFVDNGAGLYHWMTQEAIHGNWLAPFYGDLVKNLILPNWQIVAWMTVLIEFTVMALLLVGVLSRLGGFIALTQSLNLFLGLAKAPNEWIWSYGLMIIVSFIFMLTGPGRVWGVDQWLRPVLRRQIAGGNKLARYLYWLT